MLCHLPYCFKAIPPSQMGLATLLPFFSIKVFNKILKLWIFSKKSVIGLPDTITKCPVIFEFQIDNDCCSVTKSCPSDSSLLHGCWAPLSSTISQNLLKFISIESVMLSNHLILCLPFLLLPLVFPRIRVFSQWVSFSHQITKISEHQHQSVQWIFRAHFL